MPIPPSDDVVELVGHTLVIDLHTVCANLLCLFKITIVSIEARLYVEQLQLTIRTGRDGQRNLHLLRVCGSRTGICRYYLVVDIYLTLDIPVVSRRLHITIVIDTVVGVAVIDDALRLMDEVARGLIVMKICISLRIDIFLIRKCFITRLLVIFRKEFDVGNCHTGRTVLVAGIDIATTLDILLHIDKVEFNDTRDITIILFLWCAQLSSQLQIHTRSQCHLIPRGTVVTIALV